MSLRPSKRIKVPCPPLPSSQKTPSALPDDSGEVKFSLSAYHARMEKVFAELLEETKETRKKECLVLWWGNEGLRINPDGTGEWIRKPVPRDRVSSIRYHRFLADIQTPPTCCSYRRA